MFYCGPDTLMVERWNRAQAQDRGQVPHPQSLAVVLSTIDTVRKKLLRKYVALSFRLRGRSSRQARDKAGRPHSGAQLLSREVLAKRA